MTRTKKPDEGTLPNSKHMAGGEEVGVQASGYINKKGVTGETLMKPPLPPGTNIEDQACADINAMPMKTVTNLGYPGDGWS
jgi:hypothetical protein